MPRCAATARSSFVLGTTSTSERSPRDRVIAAMSAGAAEDVFSAIVGMNSMNMRKSARLARWLFSQERDALARRVLWGCERKLSYKRGQEGGPLHGGPVSGWGRRIRRLARGCLWLVSAVVLTAGLVAAALVCADALGPNGPLVLSGCLADHRRRALCHDGIWQAHHRRGVRIGGCGGVVLARDRSPRFAVGGIGACDCAGVGLDAARCSGAWRLSLPGCVATVSRRLSAPPARASPPGALT